MFSYGSVCSGIESASVAWEPLGATPTWFSEIEPFPCAVLQHHWPHVVNHGDMYNIRWLINLGVIEAPDVLVGGTPCQAFSVAGKRESLNDERGQLTLEYVRILNEIDNQRDTPAVCVWENVPGVLNTKDNAFGCFLGELAGSGCELQPPDGKRWGNAGYIVGPQRTIAWRVLDAQYFGVAQRRRRVFVVASARDGFDPGKVLFESKGVRRDTPPSREAQAPVAALTANGVGTCGADDNQAQAGHIVGALDTECGYGQQTGKSVAAGHVLPHGHRMVAFGEYADDETASTMKARDYKDATDLVVHGTQDPDVATGRSHPVGRNRGAENCVLSVALRGREGGTTTELGGEVAGTLRASTGGGDKPHCLDQLRVRRLTPTECERLQGFPDGHTKIPYRNKPADQCPDGPRYKAIGNSKAVPVVQWVGLRLAMELMQCS